MVLLAAALVLLLDWAVAAVPPSNRKHDIAALEARRSTNPVITITSYRTCSTTSVRTLPQYGWILTNGTTIPYTFSAQQGNGISSEISTTSVLGVQNGESSPAQITPASNYVLTASDFGSSVILEQGSSSITLRDGEQTTFAGQSVSALLDGSGVVIAQSTTATFAPVSDYATWNFGGQSFTAVDYDGSIVLNNGASTVTISDGSTTSLGRQTLSGLQSGNGVAISMTTTSLFTPSPTSNVLTTGGNASVPGDFSVTPSQRSSVIAPGEASQTPIGGDSASSVYDGSSVAPGGPASQTPPSSSLAGSLSPATSAPAVPPTASGPSEDVSLSSTSSSSLSPSSAQASLALSCPTPRASYAYTDPESGSQYQVQCNTTYSGSVFAVAVEPDVGSCISSCSEDLNCDAAGFNVETGLCYQYNALAAGNGVFSPTMHFAQLRSRLVNVGGSTSLVQVTSSMYTVLSIPTMYPSSGVSTRWNEESASTFPSQPTSQAGGQSATSLANTVQVTASISSELITLSLSGVDLATGLPEASIQSVTGLVLPGTTLLPGSTVTISGTTYFLATSEPGVYVNGQYTALPTAGSVLPITLPNSVVATPTGLSDLVFGSQTLFPGGSPVTISGTVYSFDSSASSPPGQASSSREAVASSLINVPASTERGAVSTALASTAASGGQSPGEAPALTIQDVTYPAVSYVPGQTPTYVVDGQILTPSGIVTYLDQGNAATISLGPAGSSLVFINGPTTVVSQIVGASRSTLTGLLAELTSSPITSLLPSDTASQAITTPPVVVVDGQSFTAMSSNFGSGPTFVVAGQTLTPGGAITTTHAGGEQTISLDPSGTAVIYMAESSTATSLVGGILASSFYSPTSPIEPSPTVSGAGGIPLTIIGVEDGAGSTIKGGSLYSVPSEQSLSETASPILPEPQLTSDVNTPPETPYIVGGQTLTPGELITLPGIDGDETLSLDPSGSGIIAIESGTTATYQVIESSLPSISAGQAASNAIVASQTPSVSALASPLDSSMASLTGLLTAAASPIPTSMQGSSFNALNSGSVVLSGSLSLSVSGGTTVTTRIGGSTLTMVRSGSTIVTTPQASAYVTVSDGSTLVVTSTGTPFVTVTGGTTRTMTMGGLQTSFVANGTTLVASVTASNAASPSADSAVVNAQIGACPEYNGLLVGASSQSSDPRLVTCGNIYEGSSWVDDAQASPDGCDSACVDSSDCVGFSYTQANCSLYDLVTGMRISSVPVYSALRLRTVSISNLNTSSPAIVSSSSTSGSFWSTLSSLLLPGPSSTSQTGGQSTSAGSLSASSSSVEQTGAVSVSSSNSELTASTSAEASSGSSLSALPSTTQTGGQSVTASSLSASVSSANQTGIASASLSNSELPASISSEASSGSSSNQSSSTSQTEGQSTATSGLSDSSSIVGQTSVAPTSLSNFGSTALSPAEVSSGSSLGQTGTSSSALSTNGADSQKPSGSDALSTSVASSGNGQSSSSGTTAQSVAQTWSSSVLTSIFQTTFAPSATGTLGGSVGTSSLGVSASTQSTSTLESQPSGQSQSLSLSGGDLSIGSDVPTQSASPLQPSSNSSFTAEDDNGPVTSIPTGLTPSALMSSRALISSLVSTTSAPFQSMQDVTSEGSLGQSSSDISTSSVVIISSVSATAVTSLASQSVLSEGFGALSSLESASILIPSNTSSNPVSTRTGTIQPEIPTTSSEGIGTPPSSVDSATTLYAGSSGVLSYSSVMTQGSGPLASVLQSGSSSAGSISDLSPSALASTLPSSTSMTQGMSSSTDLSSPATTLSPSFSVPSGTAIETGSSRTLAIGSISQESPSSGRDAATSSTSAASVSIDSPTSLFALPPVTLESGTFATNAPMTSYTQLASNTYASPFSTATTCTSAPGQLLQDGDFCDADGSSWATSGNTDLTNVSVVDQRLAMSFTSNTDQPETLLWAQQRVAARVGQTYRIMANVQILPSSALTASAWTTTIQLGNETVFVTTGDSARSFVINQTGILASDADVLRLQGRYSGSEAATIFWDNVYLSLSPQETSSVTTPSLSLSDIVLSTASSLSAISVTGTLPDDAQPTTVNSDVLTRSVFTSTDSPVQTANSTVQQSVTAASGEAGSPPASSLISMLTDTELGASVVMSSLNATQPTLTTSLNEDVSISSVSMTESSSLTTLTQQSPPSLSVPTDMSTGSGLQEDVSATTASVSSSLALPTVSTNVFPSAELSSSGGGVASASEASLAILTTPMATNVSGSSSSDLGSSTQVFSTSYASLPSPTAQVLSAPLTSPAMSYAQANGSVATISGGSITSLDQTEDYASQTAPLVSVQSSDILLDATQLSLHSTTSGTRPTSSNVLVSSSTETSHVFSIDSSISSLKTTATFSIPVSATTLGPSSSEPNISSDFALSRTTILSTSSIDSSTGLLNTTPTFSIPETSSNLEQSTSESEINSASSTTDFGVISASSSSILSASSLAVSSSNFELSTSESGIDSTLPATNFESVSASSSSILSMSGLTFSSSLLANVSTIGSLTTSTALPSFSSPSSVTSSQISQPSTACPSDTSYNTTDGTQYSVVCDRTYSTQPLAVNSSPNLDECINQCSDQAACMGTTYSVADQSCQLSSSMSPSTQRTTGTFSVLRLTAPRAAQNQTQTASNSNFADNSLSPWIAEGSGNASDFTPAGNMATANFNLAQPHFAGSPATDSALPGAGPTSSINTMPSSPTTASQATVWLRQRLRVPTGNAYSVAMNVDLVSDGNNECLIGMQTETQPIMQYTFSNGSSYSGAVNATGTMTATDSDWAMVYGSCTGNADARISVTDITWNTWPVSAAVVNSSSVALSGSPSDIATGPAVPSLTLSDLSPSGSILAAGSVQASFEATLSASLEGIDNLPTLSSGSFQSVLTSVSDSLLPPVAPASVVATPSLILPASTFLDDINGGSGTLTTTGPSIDQPSAASVQTQINESPLPQLSSGVASASVVPSILPILTTLAGNAPPQPTLSAAISDAQLSLLPTSTAASVPNPSPDESTISGISSSILPQLSLDSQLSSLVNLGSASTTNPVVGGLTTLAAVPEQSSSLISTTQSTQIGVSLSTAASYSAGLDVSLSAAASITLALPSQMSGLLDTATYSGVVTSPTQLPALSSTQGGNLPLPTPSDLIPSLSTSFPDGVATASASGSALAGLASEILASGTLTTVTSGFTTAILGAPSLFSTAIPLPSNVLSSLSVPLPQLSSSIVSQSLAVPSSSLPAASSAPTLTSSSLTGVQTSLGVPSIPSAVQSILTSSSGLIGNPPILSVPGLGSTTATPTGIGLLPSSSSQNSATGLSFSTTAVIQSSTLSAINVLSTLPSPLGSSTILNLRSTTLSTATASGTAQAALICPQNDGATYTGRDGSRYLLVCAQVYDTVTIPGLPAFVTVSLAACADFCVLQGTQCQGVTWQPDTRQCRMKTSMTPATGSSPVPAYGLMRMSGSLAVSTEVLVNGAFDAGMNAWTAVTTGVTGLVVNLLSLVFALVNGTVSCLLSLSGLYALVGALTGTLNLYIYQAVAVTAGYNWFLTADLGLINAQLSTDTACWIYFQTDQEVIWSSYYNRTSANGTIHASGTLAYVASQFQARAQCNGTTDVQVSFDNLSWRTYPRTIGSSPMILQPVSTLLNSAFTGTSLSPWTIAASSSANVDTSVTAGAALMAFNRIASASSSSPAQLLQTLTTAAQAYQNYSLTATVRVSIATGLLGLSTATCAVSIGANETLWTSSTTGSQTYAVNTRGTLANAATALSLNANCWGSKAATVTWDDVYMTLNPS